MPPVDDAEAVALSLEGLRAFGRTALYDGIITSLYYFRAERGQRALVLLTDGDDTSSSTSWEDALAYARRSGVAIYTIGLGVGELKRGARASWRSWPRRRAAGPSSSTAPTSSRAPTAASARSCAAATSCLHRPTGRRTRNGFRPHPGEGEAGVEGAGVAGSAVKPSPPGE